MVWWAKHACLSHTQPMNFHRITFQRSLTITPAIFQSMPKNTILHCGTQLVCTLNCLLHLSDLATVTISKIISFLCLFFYVAGQEDYERLRPLSYPNVSFNTESFSHSISQLNEFIVSFFFSIHTDGLFSVMLFDRKSNIIWQCVVKVVSGNSTLFTRRSDHSCWYVKLDKN